MEERAIDRLRKFQGMHVIRELSKARTRLRLIVNYQIDTFIIP